MGVSDTPREVHRLASFGANLNPCTHSSTTNTTMLIRTLKLDVKRLIFSRSKSLWIRSWALEVVFESWQNLMNHATNVNFEPCFMLSVDGAVEHSPVDGRHGDPTVEDLLGEPFRSDWWHHVADNVSFRGRTSTQGRKIYFSPLPFQREFYSDLRSFLHTIHVVNSKINLF